jgi:hypothetical protein
MTSRNYDRLIGFIAFALLCALLYLAYLAADIIGDIINHAK